MKENDLHNVDNLGQNVSKKSKDTQKIEELVAKNDQIAIDNPAP